MVDDEGEKDQPYLCSKGKITIAIGRNLTGTRLRRDEIELMFQNDYNDVTNDLRTIFDKLDSYPEELQNVLFNMRFQLGPGGFSGFHKMIEAVKAYDFESMVKEMLDSEWAMKDTPARAKRLVTRIQKLQKG